MPAVARSPGAAAGVKVGFALRSQPGCRAARGLFLAGNALLNAHQAIFCDIAHEFSILRNQHPAYRGRLVFDRRLSAPGESARPRWPAERHFAMTVISGYFPEFERELPRYLSQR
jgi:hypothetical protein